MKSRKPTTAPPLSHSISPAERLKQILAFKNSSRFVKELSHLTTPGKVPLPEQPPLIRGINALINLQINVRIHGIERFLFEDTGEVAQEMTGFLRGIGASTSAEYLQSAIALFPRGRVPKDKRLRWTQMAAIEDRRDGPSDFTLLDRRYRRTLKRELYPALHRHLRKHRNELERELDAKARVVRQRLDVSSVLDETDSIAFFDRVARSVEPDHSNAFEQQSRVVQMLTAMRGFYVSAGANGMSGFLAGGLGSVAVPALAIWAKALGAKSAYAYLVGVQAMVPGGKIPKGRALDRWVGKLEEEARQRGPSRTRHQRSDRLTQLDRKYSGATDEFVDRLRTFVRKNADDLPAALQRLAESAKPVPFRRVQRPPRRTAAKQTPSPLDLGRKIERLAAERGHRPLDGTVDPRMASFMKEILTLSTSDWVTIAGRYHAATPPIRRAYEILGRLEMEMMTGRVIPRGKVGLIDRTAARLRDRTWKRLQSKIPPDPFPGGGVQDLRDLSIDAATGAWRALRYYDWLIVGPQGLSAARAFFAPFAGFVEFPPELAKGQRP